LPLPVFPDQFIARFGKPDEDNHDASYRPKVVTRWLVYRKENVRALYSAADNENIPNSWKLREYIDNGSSVRLTDNDVLRMLAARQAAEDARKAEERARGKARINEAKRWIKRGLDDNLKVEYTDPVAQELFTAAQKERDEARATSGAGNKEQVAKTGTEPVTNPPTKPATKRPADLPPLSERAMIHLETEVSADNRVTVWGYTNLPPGTHLIVSVEGVSLARNTDDSVVKVAKDQTFQSDRFGARKALANGVYKAEVVMPVAGTQPAAVRGVIGEKGENLRGPLVEDDGSGKVVITSRQFVVETSGK